MSGELHMLPVKAGDATLIVDRTPERPFTVLIDAGLTDQEIIAYLHSVGVFHLDLVVLSHPDLDPLQGLLAVVDNPLMSIGKIWCFDLGFLREFVTTWKTPQAAGSGQGSRARQPALAGVTTGVPACD